MTTSTLNLYQRINEIRKSIDYIKKDKSVSTGGGSYQAVTHDQVIGMVRDYMVKHGVVSYPYLIESCMNLPMVDVDGKQAKQARYEATYDFCFVNIDVPEEKLTIRIEAHAMDNADKATGKALSYAKKYAILKLFEIETGEDDESRYQEKETFDLNFYNKLLENSQTVEELQSNYLDAKSQAVKCSDSSAMKAINAKTSQLKAKLLAS